MPSTPVEGFLFNAPLSILQSIMFGFAQMSKQTPQLIGTSLPDRRAALRLRGEGVFTADVALEDPLYVAFARSDVTCGQIIAADLTAA